MMSNKNHLNLAATRSSYVCALMLLACANGSEASDDTNSKSAVTSESGVKRSAVDVADAIQRAWNPNCAVQGGREIQVQVIFAIAEDGKPVGVMTSDGAEWSSDPIVRAAAERAIAAVYGASPFRTLHQEMYGQRVKVNFNAREACS